MCKCSMARAAELSRARCFGRSSRRKLSSSRVVGAMRPALLDALAVVRLPDVSRPSTMGSCCLCVVSEAPSESLGRLLRGGIGR
jgi:hypothetical protein